MLSQWLYCHFEHVFFRLNFKELRQIFDYCSLQMLLLASVLFVLFSLVVVYYEASLTRLSFFVRCTSSKPPSKIKLKNLSPIDLVFVGLGGVSLDLKEANHFEQCLEGPRS